MRAMFLFGCGILLIVVVSLVFYARAIEREKVCVPNKLARKPSKKRNR